MQGHGISGLWATGYSSVTNLMAGDVVGSMDASWHDALRTRHQLAILIMYSKEEDHTLRGEGVGKCFSVQILGNHHQARPLIRGLLPGSSRGWVYMLPRWVWHDVASNIGIRCDKKEIKQAGEFKTYI